MPAAALQLQGESGVTQGHETVVVAAQNVTKNIQNGK
jgi:hypothetical protein